MLVSWTENSSPVRVFLNRWNGEAWDGTQELLGPASPDLYWGRPLFTSGSRALVTYEGDGGVYVSLSADGGQTFYGYQRLDAEAPVPEAYSSNIRPTTDGQGNVWVVWDDGSAGRQNSLPIRYSPYDGESFRPVYRLNRNEPQGGRTTIGFWIANPIDTLPGAAFVGFLADRASDLPDVRLNAYDTGDFDRDAAGIGSDCDDADPGVKAVPGEISGLTVTRSEGTITVSWDSQAESAGRDTVYDLAGGDLASLIADAGFAAATCRAAGLTTTSWDDDDPLPSPGSGEYDVMRARNACGTGTYGDSTLVPDPRDDLDAASPCP
ncbi:MAG: hypothetical protein JSV80_11625 [Acidobacteriota bacterium]|nr:MAG: hypothetical protein JSV80_11625 [Acidobacteriota bacterium]